MIKVALVFVVVLLAGCAENPFRPDPIIQTVSVNKPVLYCPAPPEFIYPKLVILDLVPGDEKDPGKVAQHYKAVVKQLEGEIKARDRALRAYEEIQTIDPYLKPIQVERIFKELTK